MSGGVETPAMAQAKVQYQNKIKADNINRDTSVVSGTSKPVSSTQDISDKFVSSNGMDYAKQFQTQVAGNPELVDLKDKVNSTDKQIKDLETDKNNTLKKIAADHP